MSVATLTRDDLAPRQPPGMRAGLVLAVLAHLLLIAALTWSVRWKTSEPDSLEAELWSTTPQVAASRAVVPEVQTPTRTPTPTPTPTPQMPMPTPPVAREPSRADAQIALERAAEARRREAELAAQRLERQQRDEARQDAARRDETKRLEARRVDQERDKALERQRLAESQARALAEKKELAAKTRQDETRLAASREANLKRMMGQANANTGGDEGATGTAARTSGPGPSSGWAGRIKARIKPNIVLANAVSGNPLASVEVRLAPDGTIVGRRILKSGGAAWDEVVLRAIDKTEVLPRDVDGRVQPSIVIDFRPLE